VIEVGGVRVGLATCFDLRFADQFTALGRDGAELVVVPASWGAGPGKEEQWDLLTRARATDAQAWLWPATRHGHRPPETIRSESAAPCWSTRSARCAPDSGSPLGFCARK
jgi:predicted amidohydrolase